MILSTDLLHDLDHLTACLDDVDIDLSSLAREAVSDLDDVAAGVASVSVTIVMRGSEVEIATTPPRTHTSAVSSLRLNLLGGSMQAHAHLLVRSGVRGSLTNFAEDAAREFGWDAVELDKHLDVVEAASSLSPTAHSTLAEESETNRALGVLVDGGRTPNEGRAEMKRLAVIAGTPVVDVARRVLRDAVRWHPPR